MIIAIADDNGSAAKSILAVNLATMRAAHGRRVLLLEGNPRKLSLIWSKVRHAAARQPTIPCAEIARKNISSQLENLVVHYDDVVIDTDDRDTLPTRSALVFAHKVIVPLDLGRFSPAAQYQLSERVAIARLNNPHLEVLFIIVTTEAEASLQAIATARAFIATMAGADLADAVIHPAPFMSRALASGLAISEWPTVQEKAVHEMKSLYQQAFLDKRGVLQRQQQAVSHRRLRQQITWLRRVIFKLLP